MNIQVPKDLLKHIDESRGDTSRANFIVDLIRASQTKDNNEPNRTSSKKSSR